MQRVLSFAQVLASGDRCREREFALLVVEASRCGYIVHATNEELLNQVQAMFDARDALEASFARINL